MKRGSGATASVWMTTANISSRPALAEDITTDVCIVGAGIAGLRPLIYSRMKAGRSSFLTMG